MRVSRIRARASRARVVLPLLGVLGAVAVAAPTAEAADGPFCGADGLSVQINAGSRCVHPVYHTHYSQIRGSIISDPWYNYEICSIAKDQSNGAGGNNTVLNCSARIQNISASNCTSAYPCNGYATLINQGITGRFAGYIYF